MVTIRRPAVGLVARPALRQSARRGAPPVARFYDGGYLLAAVPAILLHLLVITRGVGGPAAEGEALAVAAAQDGGLATAPADLAFVRQLALAQSVLGPVNTAGLLQTARGVCLLAGLLTALLLWVVARRTLPGRDAAAVAVVVAGSSPVALFLHADVDAGALAAFWLVVAAALGTVTRPAAGHHAVGGSRWLGDLPVAPPAAAAAAVACAAAVLTAPLVAAGLLALVAGLAVRDLPVPADRRRAGRVVVAVAAGVAAVGVAVLAVARHSPTTAPDTVDGPLFGTTLVVGVGLVVVGFWRVPRLRPVAVAASVWLACALWPGSARLTALLLALPLLALLAGALVGDASARRRLPVAAVAAVAVALTAGVVAVAWPFETPATATYRSVAQWLSAELDPTTRLQADALTRTELVARGVPTDRFVTGAAPDAARVVPLPTGCGSDEAAIAMIPAPGGGVVLCRPGGSTAPDGIADVGPALAGNPALTLSAAAHRALADNRVDTRLAVVLAGAAASHRITIADFPPTPGAPSAAPRRTAVITVGGAGVETYLSGQLPAYRPELSRRPDGSLIAHFRIPPTPR